MRKFVLLALLAALLLGLSGCASPPLAYGSFIQTPLPAHDRAIADDAVKQLARLYPPARTRFDLQHGAPDFFGTYLVESLRARGYAVLELKPAGQGQALALAQTQAPAPAMAANAASFAAPSPSGLPLSYLLDQDAGSQLYRLTLLINRQQSLTRAYQVQGGTMHPAGYWVRKE